MKCAIGLPGNAWPFENVFGSFQSPFGAELKYMLNVPADACSRLTTPLGATGVNVTRSDRKVRNAVFSLGEPLNNESVIPGMSVMYPATSATPWPSAPMLR